LFWPVSFCLGEPKGWNQQIIWHTLKCQANDFAMPLPSNSYRRWLTFWGDCSPFSAESNIPWMRNGYYVWICLLMHASVGIAIPKSHLALCKASMFCRQMKFGPGIFLTQVCLSSAPNVGQSCSVLAKMAPLKAWLSSAHKEDSCAAQGFRSLQPPPPFHFVANVNSNNFLWQPQDIAQFINLLWPRAARLNILINIEFRTCLVCLCHKKAKSFWFNKNP